MILESEGWEVMNLGPNTPLFALSDMVKQKRASLVCISGRTLADLDRAAIEYGQLRKAVVVGGEAFRDPILRARFPAQLYATDFEAVSKFARALAKKKA